MSIFLLMLPLLLIVLTGYCSAKFSLFSEESNAYFTGFAFFVAMPCQLFFDFSKTPVSQSINVLYVLAFVSCMLITGTFMFVFSRFFLKKSLAESALNIMGSSQVNTAYFAIPLFILIFNNPTPVLPILIFQVLILTMIVLLIIEHDLKEKSTENHGYYFEKIKSVFLIMLKNPIILACILGIGFSFFHIQTPVVINKVLKLMGETAAPLALFALGQSLFFDLKKIVGKELMEVSIITFIKLLILPTLAFFIGKYIFHLSQFWLASLILMAAMPSPKNMFIFAVRYKLDVKKASTVVAVSTLLSFITLNLLLVLLHPSI
jgi:malonate transporter